MKENLENLIKSRSQLWEENQPDVNEFIRFIWNADFHKVNTPFLRGLIGRLSHTDIQKRELYGPFEQPDDLLLVNIGEGCAHSLLQHGWNGRHEKLEQARDKLVFPKSKKGVSVTGSSIMVFSLLLQGASPQETKDYLYQHDKKMKTDLIDKIRQEISEYVDFPSPLTLQRKQFRNGNLTPEQLIFNGRVREDDTIPYLDMDTVSAESWSGLIEGIKERINHRIATYGGINSDVLLTAAVADNPDKIGIYERAEVSPTEDEFLGLRMPKVWYYNPKWPSLATAMYYNLQQIKPQLRHKEKNRSFREKFGVVGLVECYDIRGLCEFAEKNHYVSFSTPFDLILTADYITTGDTVNGLARNNHFIGFTDEVIGYGARLNEKPQHKYKQYLESLEYSERRLHVLSVLKMYWQDILYKRGVRRGDEEIILLNLSFDARDPKAIHNGLSANRRPRIVYMGGNIDNNHTVGQDPVVIIARNLALTQRQYGPATKIIIPQYSDSSGNVFFPKMLNHSLHNITNPDAIIAYLFTMRELGMDQEYWDLRTRYEELSRKD